MKNCIFEPKSKEKITFGNDKEQIIQLLLQLNKDEDFKVTQIDENNFKIKYDGGYNNVYDCETHLEIIGLTQNIHDKFFYWSFKLKSDYYDTTIEVDNFNGTVGFLDFFLDDFIKEIGNCINQEDYNY